MAIFRGIRRAIYTGDLKHLKGRRAFVMADPNYPNQLLAQFDDISLTRRGPRSARDKSLGYGWHRFPEDVFTIEDPEEDDNG